MRSTLFLLNFWIRLIFALFYDTLFTVPSICIFRLYLSYHANGDVIENKNQIVALFWLFLPVRRVFGGRPVLCLPLDTVFSAWREPGGKFISFGLRAFDLPFSSTLVPNFFNGLYPFFLCRQCRAYRRNRCCNGSFRYGILPITVKPLYPSCLFGFTDGIWHGFCCHILSRRPLSEHSACRRPRSSTCRP